MRSLGKNILLKLFLIKWANSRGQLESLLIAAYNTNPDNEKLQSFYKTIIQQRFTIN
ncbi:effector-associated domain EAD1-containing protein [Nostoc mirabile]|uniref:effector-associated domain EAD1-containing protein n=1 Tax=Nostoc mirabile TaxID=2907820 RepID=UPI00355915E2